MEEDPAGERTVVVVPSLTLEPEDLRWLRGTVHYEERMLSALTRLSQPRTRVLFISSCPIAEEVVSYALQFLPGVPSSHARERLWCFSVNDASDRPLAEKLLERPLLLERIRRALVRPEASYLEVYRSTGLERRLAVALGIPLMGPAPELQALATKSGARALFAELGIEAPPGSGRLRDLGDLAEALARLHREQPSLRRAVIKLDEGCAGLGNAIFPLGSLGLPGDLEEVELARRAREQLPRRTHLPGRGRWPSWEAFLAALERGGGVVEGFLEGTHRESPTLELSLTPDGRGRIEATHDQILGGTEGMAFQGSRLPARPELRGALHEAAGRLLPRLAGLGVIGPVSVDFVALRDLQGTWSLRAVELDMRWGGTTHPLDSLKFLTGGSYQVEDGEFRLPSGERRCYVASDGIAPQEARGLSPQDLLDLSTCAGLHYNSSAHRGVLFHMVGGLSEFGRLGATCVAGRPEEAQDLHDQTRRVLQDEAGSTWWLG